MESFLYFTYGSNMLAERLKERCPRAEFVGVAEVEGYSVDFSKVSKDGSGKATLSPTLSSTARGSLFRIPTSERSHLDDAEGPGYWRDDAFLVRRSDDKSSVKVTTYLAEKRALNSRLLPYDWYRDLIVAGAEQCNLPLEYRQVLESSETIPDPEPTRKSRLLALTLLNRRWEAGLSEVDGNVVRVAKRLYSTLSLPGACYRASFFLAYYLKQRFGIDGTPMVGYVNDSTDDLFSSHAWYEMDGRVTDLAISRPLNPDFQRRGPLTILGRELQPGWRWTYHAKRSVEGERAIVELLQDPRARQAVQDGEDLHQMMFNVASSQERIRTYLDGAPDGLTFEVLASRIG
jgi:gamma-glutamylcyclotransferase